MNKEGHFQRVNSWLGLILNFKAKETETLLAWQSVLSIMALALGQTTWAQPQYGVNHD